MGDLLPSIPEGQNDLWHTDRGGGQPLVGRRMRYWSFLYKPAKSLPLRILQVRPGTAVGPFHRTNCRLTFQEMCRLQTFPDGLSIDCGRAEMQRQIGNAVPSLIVGILAREIRAQFFGRPIKTALKLLPRKRNVVPSPENVARLPPVPTIYRPARHTFWRRQGAHGAAGTRCQSRCGSGGMRRPSGGGNIGRR